MKVCRGPHPPPTTTQHSLNDECLTALYSDSEPVLQFLEIFSVPVKYFSVLVEGEERSKFVSLS